jgi:hypothetical protein
MVCVAATCWNSVAPMPNASAPRAPWVQVWLSLQTMEAPGSVSPSSGADHVHDALAGLPEIEQPDALGLGLVAQVLEVAQCVGRVAGSARGGGDGVVGRCEGELGVAHAMPALAQRSQRLAAGVTYQVAVHVQQGEPVAQVRHHVGVPYLVEERAACHALSRG